MRQSAGEGKGFTYTGEQLDTETGMVFLRARTYDPSTGRFLQRDTFAGTPSDPATLNRYSYSADNPVVNTDPNGHWVHIAAGVGLGALISYGAQVAGNIRDGGLSPEAFTDVDWRQVGAGAVAGGVGAATFGVGTAAMGVMGVRGIGASVLSDSLSGYAATMAEAFVMGECRSLPMPTLDDLAWYAVGPVAKKASGLLRPTNGIMATEETLDRVAAKVAAGMGPGIGGVYGTRFHNQFRIEVGALGRPDLATEISYLNGFVVPGGTPGSIAADVVKGRLDSPQAVFDLKTGSAKLSMRRMEEIRRHIGDAHLPVLEIHP